MLNFPKEQTFDGKDRGGTRLPEGQSRQTPRAFRTGSIMTEPRWLVKERQTPQNSGQQFIFNSTRHSTRHIPVLSQSGC